MHLHSHQIAWGSGSGQQSVTTHSVNNDQGDLWSIQGAYGQQFCEAGTPIQCGSTIRLTHVQTNKNLHSHLFKAALSGFQEISAFGEGGKGDTGDNWVVECGFISRTSVAKDWLRGAPISLKHVDTSKYLYTATGVSFNQQNCGVQCPIMGQSEVSCAPKKDSSKTTWYTTQGVYFPPKDEMDRDEL